MQADEGKQRQLDALRALAPHTSAAALWGCILARVDHIYEALEGLLPVFEEVMSALVATADGASVFVSNRGLNSEFTNSIAGFRVLPAGRLELAQLAPSGTRFPRGMALSADSKQLLVAGQGSGNLVRFDVVAPGTLRLPGAEIADGLATPTTVVELQLT